MKFSTYANECFRAFETKTRKEQMKRLSEWDAKDNETTSYTYVMHKCSITNIHFNNISSIQYQVQFLLFCLFVCFFFHLAYKFLWLYFYGAIIICHCAFLTNFRCYHLIWALTEEFFVWFMKYVFNISRHHIVIIIIMVDCFFFPSAACPKRLKIHILTRQ